MATQIIQHSPGQQVTIMLETTNSINERISPTTAPNIDKILTPSLTELDGYPQAMTELYVGLYYFQFTLPSGASSVGTYVVDTSWVNPSTSATIKNVFLIVVSAPYGIYSVTT